ncbi:MAG: sigma 54-interacting transcriptional regulator, partial [Desulfovibrionales bacterium]|nr:sigma 54-interacting transcriptional regulator [Desulfovibrionales bacterium]
SRIGICGYIVTAQGERLPISVSTAVFRDPDGKPAGGAETFRDLSEIDALKRELHGRYHVGELSSRSPRMQRLFSVLPAIAASPSTVLITGETGTGKELFARTIHSLSPQGSGPFVAVNCAALPDTLLESELFGHKSGAFTGAIKDRLGRFAQARGGSIFLDEIGEISPALQVRLLRVLQERTFEPLGSSKTESTDARVIAATNRNLSKLISDGTFREDLYYRINVVRLELPPLRERREDIGILIEQFIRHFNRIQNRAVSGISAETLSLLTAHDWPGNIRELENVIERAFILCGDGRIDMAHLPEDLRIPSCPHRQEDLASVHSLLDMQAIQNALERNNFSRLAAARELGIHKTTLFRRMKRLGMALPDVDGRSRKVE